VIVIYCTEANLLECMETEQTKHFKTDVKKKQHCVGNSSATFFGG